MCHLFFESDYTSIFSCILKVATYWIFKTASILYSDFKLLLTKFSRDWVCKNSTLTPKGFGPIAKWLGRQRNNDFWKREKIQMHRPSKSNYSRYYHTSALLHIKWVLTRPSINLTCLLILAAAILLNTSQLSLFNNLSTAKVLHL